MRSIFYVLATVVVLGIMSENVSATTVFFEDFNESNGTVVINTTPEIGQSWSGTESLTMNDGEVDTSSDSDSYLFGVFNDTLSAGETLVLRFDANDPSGNFFGNWAGVSLFYDGNEASFTGGLAGPSTTNWVQGVPVPDNNGMFYHVTDSFTDTDQDNVLLTYVYDTGECSLSFDGITALIGTITPNLPLDQVRIASGGNAGIAIDSIQVDFQAVPEPSTLILLLGSVATLCAIRRRK